MQRQQVEFYLDTEVQEENKELEFKATTLRIEFEAITTLKNHLDNAEATRRTLNLTPRCKKKTKS